MIKIFIDFETKSFSPLPKVGAWVYSEHPSTDIIMMSYAVEDAPPQMWHPGLVIPDFESEDFVYIARNALFEYAIAVNVGIPKYNFPERMRDIKNWNCTRVSSLQIGLPASLENCGEALGIATKKLDTGKRLINKYSKPAKDRSTGELYFNEITPEDFDAWKQYNMTDVEADRQCDNIIEKYDIVANLEKEVVLQDFEINARGVKIDVKSLDKMEIVIAEATAKAKKEADRYGLNVSSPKQLLEYLHKKGFEVDNTQEQVLEEIETDDTDVKDILALRSFLGKASVKKYAALRSHLCSDGRLRYFLKYYGATPTGRWSSEGVQLHNLPKTETGSSEKEIEFLIKNISADLPYRELVTQCKKILPGLIVADEGCKFIMGDFANIEARVLAYLSGQWDILDDMINGVDLYKKNAAAVFNKRVEDIDKNERQLGKRIELACGYGMGHAKFLKTCKAAKLNISSELAEKAVKTYRQTRPAIDNFWNDLQRAFTLEGRNFPCGLKVMRRGKRYEIHAPSGHIMYYHNVRNTPDGLVYHNYQKGFDVKLYGGILAENVCQWIARLVLSDRMQELKKHGIETAFTVHDEIIAITGEKDVDKNKKIFDEITNTAPEWLPNFPLKTVSVVSGRYFK